MNISNVLSMDCTIFGQRSNLSIHSDSVYLCIAQFFITQTSKFFIEIQNNDALIHAYCLSEKSCSFLESKLLYKNVQDFLNIQLTRRLVDSIVAALEKPAIINIQIFTLGKPLRICERSRTRIQTDKPVYPFKFSTRALTNPKALTQGEYLCIDNR